MNQLQLPLSFEDMIPENHLVRGRKYPSGQFAINIPLNMKDIIEDVFYEQPLFTDYICYLLLCFP